MYMNQRGKILEHTHTWSLVGEDEDSYVYGGTMRIWYSYEVVHSTALWIN